MYISRYFSAVKGRWDQIAISMQKVKHYLGQSILGYKENMSYTIWCCRVTTEFHHHWTGRQWRPICTAQSAINYPAVDHHLTVSSQLLYRALPTDTDRNNRQTQQNNQFLLLDILVPWFIGPIYLRERARERPNHYSLIGDLTHCQRHFFYLDIAQ